MTDMFILIIMMWRLDAVDCDCDVIDCDVLYYVLFLLSFDCSRFDVIMFEIV